MDCESIQGSSQDGPSKQQAATANPSVLSKRYNNVKKIKILSRPSKSSMKPNVIECAESLRSLVISKSDKRIYESESKEKLSNAQSLKKNSKLTNQRVGAILKNPKHNRGTGKTELGTNEVNKRTIPKTQSGKTLVFTNTKHGGSREVKEIQNTCTSKSTESDCKKNTETQGKRRKSKKVEYVTRLLPTAQLRKLLEQDPLGERYITGHMHISKKLHGNAYVIVENAELDLQISRTANRNSALDGDLVVARVDPEEKWQDRADGQKRKTGIVIGILEKLHPRRAIGYIKQMEDKLVFYPRDRRIPILHIYPDSLKRVLKEEPKNLEEILFNVRLTNFNGPCHATGQILNIIGKQGEIEAESKAILIQHGLNVNPYGKYVTEKLPKENYVLSDDDTKNREDWRDECIFTIDPSTAVDLDDAVSCKLLTNGNYEIGVHIADVTHFLEFLSPLDLMVAKRATTVYMPDNVYHMLPEQLCKLCSLLPGCEKLAFSVIWEMTPKADIIKHRFAKTIIKSCCQMSYEQAQKMIDQPDHDWPNNFLQIAGKFSIRDLSQIVNKLFKLSVHLRNKRYMNGALRIGLPKLRVLVDRDTGLPTSYTVEEQKESNRLIEEFMLLANMTVADHLYTAIPETALLRNHAQPSMRILQEAKTLLKQYDIRLNIESVKELETSLRYYESKYKEDTDDTMNIIQYKMMVINHLCLNAMARAKYKCSSSVETKEQLRHYALNVPLYTHFTSPIRRYIDCAVHRLLHWSIHDDMSSAKSWTRDLCIQIASNCNTKNYNAKMAQEESNKLYFAYLIGITGAYVALAVVLKVNKESLNTMLCHVGIRLTVYFDDIKDKATVESSNGESIPSVKITWKEPVTTSQVINVFSLLYVQVEKKPKYIDLQGLLLPPLDNC